MTIVARVHNHTINLPPEMEIPEGTEVQVTLPEIRSEGQPQSFFETIQDLVGTAQGLPADFAAEHDHYIHGTRKRSAQ